MPSIYQIVQTIFGGLDVLDDTYDLLGTVARVTGNGPQPEGEETVNLEKVRKISAAMIQIIEPFLSSDTRPAFLRDIAASERVTTIYYDRLDAAGKDQYEKIFGEVWTAICFNLGVPKPPPQPNQKGQRGQQQRPQPQSQPNPANPLADIPLADLYRAVDVCIGKKAIDADRKAHRDPITGLLPDEAPPTPQGDAVIKKELERLRQATVGQKAAKAAATGLDRATEWLKKINDKKGY